MDSEPISIDLNMNNLLLINSSKRLCPLRHEVLRLASKSTKDGSGKHESPPPKKADFSRLQNILSNMKIKKSIPVLFQKTGQFGNSDLFNYATNKNFNPDELKAPDSDTWTRLYQYEVDNSHIGSPLNGLEEMIILTEQGKLWRYPIDNEQGMDEEKKVPFEDHVFLEHLLEDFPEHDYIRQFMGFICSGLARNHWMTAERKHEIIKFYKNYFEEHRELYKTAGLEI